MTAATYDGTGTRATATTSAGTQQFVWNTVPSVPQLIMDSSSAYIYAGGATPAEQVSLSAGTINYLVADSLGSVRGTVSSAGALTGTTGYDAWGNPQTTGGLTATTPFGFSGGYTDSDGLVYLLNRYYEPATGQFLSVDPQLSQTLQAYAYADDNPVSLSDPTGLWWDYATNQRESRLSENIWYDFSLNMGQDVEKVPGTIVKVGTFVQSLIGIITGILTHNLAIAVASVLGSLLVVIGMSVPVIRKVVKALVFKGKHVKNGFTSRTFEDVFNQTYESSENRSCTSEAASCGSPGKVFDKH